MIEIAFALFILVYLAVMSLAQIVGLVVVIRGLRNLVRSWLNREVEP